VLYALKSQIFKTLLYEEVNRLSKSLMVAIVLLLIFGGWGFLEGIMALFSPEYYLEMWITMMNEELRPATVSEIGALGQNLLEFMTFTTQMLGLVMLFACLLLCVIVLVPYRKGQKWAWYAMVIIGGIYILGALALTYVGMTSHAPVSIVMALLWIVGVALPAKEILGKPS
jgi:hypothetical protein